MTGRKVLLTGRPGVGKTTAITRTVRQLAIPAAGFVTQELREDGQRVGFEIRTLDGERGILAHVDRPGGPRISRYGVNLGALHAVGVAAIERGIQAGHLLVIDEIGPMELLSDPFRDAVWAALESELPVLGTIMSRPHPYADEIKAREEVQVVEITRANRDPLVDRLVGTFGGGP